MDLEQIWQQNGSRDDALDRLLEKGDFNKLHSRFPLKKLKTNLLLGIILAVIITLGYIALLFVISAWQIIAVLVVMIAFNLLVTYQSWNLYKKTPVTVMASNSLKQELMSHYNSFQNWWRIQQKMGIFVYPISATGGFILGGIEGSGKTVEEFLYNPKVLLALAIALLILVPLCYLTARWMFNYAYGKHLKKLKATIDELSS